ncbi:MAG: LEA family epithelial adhesin, partial [Lactobacillus crispatus]|nr:LEA family epithelial adhesin [Lactobacillus crispatus]MCT7698763.1 LEA family epithelial adhesin [Lactobacillus crispatus]
MWLRYYLGVTIFGINLTDHSVKAATTESVATEKVQQNGASNGVPEKVQQNGASNDVTEKVQQNSGSKNATANNSTESATTLQSSPKTQGSASKNATANNPTESATTSQSLPKTQGSAHTYIRSLAAKSAFMNLMAASGTPTGTGTGTGTPTGTGTNRNAGDTVDQNNINDQPAKENQKLANEHNLTSSDNYSSNIYQGKDKKNYYKVVTIYGNDYVYHAADIQANGNDATAEDTKNNINISKEDLGNGKTRWTVVFFPNKGLKNVGGTLHGLIAAKFGIALTKDYQIDGNVDMEVINDPNQKYTYYKFEDGSNSSTSSTVQNPPAEVKFSFNPNTDVNSDTGLINSETLPAYNNKYLQPSYYFTTATNAGIQNLWQTYFKDGVEYNNAYDGSPYLGGDYDFHLNSFTIKNKTGVDGLESKDLKDPKAQIPIIYDTLGARKFNSEANPKGVFSSDNFNQAMEFKSQGKSTGSIFYSRSQYSSYVISFTTRHTDSHEIELSPGSNNQQFSGIAANIFSFQNGSKSKFSRLYGEQRVLDSTGAVVKPNDVISGWVDATRAFDQINKDYLNNAQIYALRYKIQNNVTDSNALNNIIKEGNSLNDAMKKLGNSIGQYDPDGKFADHKEDTTKASDRYIYANPDKKAAYDNATEVTKALINKDTGAYADQATVEKLTEAENKAWNELKVVLANKITPNVPTTKEPVANTSSLTQPEKDKVKQNVEDANKDKFPAGTKVTVGDDGTATITYPDGSKDTIPGDQLVQGQKGDTTDAGNITPTIPGGKVTVKDPSHLTDDEKNQVKNNVDNANKDKFPEGTKVTVGDDGTATIKYPDGSKDTIP